MFTEYAERLHDSPGAARLARLARTAKRLPASLLTDVMALVVRLGDVQLAGNDIAIHLIEVGYCDAKYADATEFVTELKDRLQHYADHHIAAADARGDLRERAAWWRMAIGRTADLCRRPATVLMETYSNV